MQLSCGWDKQVPSAKVMESGHKWCCALLPPCPAKHAAGSHPCSAVAMGSAHDVAEASAWYTPTQFMGDTSERNHSCFILNGIY